MATITWKGSAGGSWTTSTNWNPTGVPDSSNTATIDVSSAELFNASETVGAVDIGPSGALLVDYISGQSGATLTVTGTLTNDGGPAGSHGLAIGNSAVGSTTVTLGALDNATTSSAIGIQNATVTVTGNVSNAGTGSNAGFDLEDGAAVTVDGNFTNTGKLGLDHFDPADAGSTLTIDGTLTNSGGGTSNGMGIFNAGSKVEVGALNNSGTLFGIGIIQGNVTNSGIVLAGDEGSPDTPGTLTITGNYSQTSTSTVDEVLNTNGPTFSTIAVTGAVDLSGGTLDLIVPEGLGNPQVGHNITLMTFAPGELTGSFASFKYGSTTTTGQILEVDGVALQIAYGSSAITLNVVNAGQTDTWVGGPSFGDWTTPSNWTADRVPGSTHNTADSAVIELGGVQITNENAGTIASLTTGPYNKNGVVFQAGYLSFDDGQLTVSNNVTNQGEIELDGSSGNSGSNFVVLGTLTNSSDADDHTSIGIGNSEGDGSTTATFGNFVNTATARIDIDNATVTVTGNVTNNGDAPGVKGMGVAFFASESASNPDPGVADVGGTLIVDGTYTNNGAFGIGNVDIAGLAKATVNKLDNAAAGTISITGNNTLGSLGFARLGVAGGTNAGKISVADNGVLEIGGTFSNSGVIALDRVINPAELQVNDAGLSLTGGGKVTLSGNASTIVSAPDAFTGVTVGGTDVVAGDTITLTFTNPNLSLNKPVIYTVATDGELLAAVASGLASAVDSDPTLSPLGILAAVNGAQIYIVEPSTVANTTLVITSVDDTGGNETLSGGGALSGGADPTFTNVNNMISGTGRVGDPYMTLNNEGIIDANVAAVQAHPTALTLDTGANTISNSGTLESTASGGLDVLSDVANSKTIEALGNNANVTIASTITNTSTGVVLASGTGANVQLNQAEIMDGKLETTGTGLIETATGTTSQFSDVTITSGSVVEVYDNTGLALDGTITNSGTIKLNAAAHPTTLVILGPAVSLTGSGKVTLGGSDSANNVIDAPSGAATLTNVNNTISGAGTIGDVNNTNLTFDNEGIVNANSSTNPLILNTDTNPITNSGTLESTAAGGLDIDSNVTNTGGLILASGTGAKVDLDNATIIGGTLKTSGTNAAIEATGTGDEINNATITAGSLVEAVTGTLTLDGGTIGAGTIVEALSGGILSVTGTAANSGTLFANGALSLVQIAGGAVTGSGKAEVGDGTVEMQGASAENVTFQAGGTGTLQLDGLGTAYTGKVTGFGQNGTNISQLIDFNGVNFTGSSFTYTKNASNTGGTLSVTDGTNSASVTLVGTYTQAGFQKEEVGTKLAIIDPPVTEQQPGNAPASVGNGAIVEINTPDSGNATFTGSTGTLVLDQPSTFTGTVAGLGAQNAIDLSGIDFGANTTLGYTENKSGTGGTLTVADGTHSANVALLGNYMASSFVTESDGHGGTAITDPNLTAANQPTLAAHPA